MYVWNDTDAVVFEIQDELILPSTDTAELVTQRLADAFALSIAKHPTDWHMLQRVWPDLDTP